MNRITLETVGNLPNPRHVGKGGYGKPPEQPYRYDFDTTGGKEGFGIGFWFDSNGFIESVTITDNDDGGCYYLSNLAFPKMRTFEELKEVCRLLDITYPENWPQ